MGGARDVVVYELNEVPWQIIDLYVGERPDSTLATVLTRGESLTTVNPDTVYLQPWRTWPTFHTGLLTEDHNSYELGQDPETLRGEAVWDAAESAGLKVGLFGVLQSWPPRSFEHGGFWVPDTFARTPETVPPKLGTFQEFNLSMTADNTFSANAPLDAKRMARVAVDLVARGLTPRSAVLLARQVLRERREERWKAARPMAQVLPAFDLYWRLQRKVKPNLSVFFTNHVAGMMHRYWGDAVPGYSEDYGYERDDVFARFLFEALDLFDAQLRKIVRWVDSQPAAALVIASSMGQAPVQYHDIADSYVLRDPDRLTLALGLAPSEPGLAMYPRYAFQYGSPEDAEQAQGRLEAISLEGDPFFSDFDLNGRTLSAAVSGFKGTGSLVVDSDGRRAELEELGFAVEERLGGGNTAHHIPQGIWISYGDGVPADSSRAEFSALEAKPRLLDMLGAQSESQSRAPAATS